MYTYYTRNDMYNQYNQRFGGFLIPFLLGGLGGAFITGAYQKPNQYPTNQVPNQTPNFIPPNPYPGYSTTYFNQGYYPYGF